MRSRPPLERRRGKELLRGTESGRLVAMALNYIIDYFAAKAVGHVGVVPSEEVRATGYGGNGDMLRVTDLVLRHGSFGLA